MRKPRTQDRPKRSKGPRNWLAVSAHLRQAGAMKDRRAPRGGGRTWRGLLEGGLPSER